MKKRELEELYTVLMKIQNPDQKVNWLIGVIRNEINMYIRRGKRMEKENEKYYI